MYFLPSFEPLLHSFLVLTDHVAVLCLMDLRMTRITQTLEIGVLESELPHLAHIAARLHRHNVVDTSSSYYTSLRLARLA